MQIKLGDQETKENSQVSSYFIIFNSLSYLYVRRSNINERLGCKLTAQSVMALTPKFIIKLRFPKKYFKESYVAGQRDCREDAPNSSCKNCTGHQ